jgi:hypothetical protein
VRQAVHDDESGVRQTGSDEHYAQELDDPAALDPDRIPLRREIIAPAAD